MAFEISKRTLVILLSIFILTTVSLVLIISLKLINIYSKNGCIVSVNNGLANPQTLILKSGVHHGLESFHWPPYEGSLRFIEDEVIILSCPGGALKINGVSSNEVSAEAKCSYNSFTILGKTVAFNDISCSKFPFHTARYTGRSCFSDSREIEVGFKLKDGQFLRHIVVCFDDQTCNTRYTSFNLTKSIGGYQSNFPRPDFIEGSFYKLPTSLKNVYNRNRQRETINALLGLPASSTKYIHNSSDLFLTKGHMAAKADFVYGSQQRLTFYYINVAPQWQTFNGGNWNSLEIDIRTYASSKQKDLVVYTGVHGVATLPHSETGEDIPLYLYVDEKETAIPVPQIFWKVIYDPSVKAATAFVGVNNPYEKNVENSIFCKSKCDQINWLRWKERDHKKGFSYCCDVDELRKTVENIPKFEVASLLV